MKRSGCSLKEIEEIKEHASHDVWTYFDPC